MFLYTYKYIFVCFSGCQSVCKTFMIEGKTFLFISFLVTTNAVFVLLFRTVWNSSFKYLNTWSLFFLLFSKNVMYVHTKRDICGAPYTKSMKDKKHIYINLVIKKKKKITCHALYCTHISRMYFLLFPISTKYCEFFLLRWTQCDFNIVHLFY